MTLYVFNQAIQSFIYTVQEAELTLPQLLDEHKLTSRHKLKDSPGRTGDSWRIRTTGVIESELLASPPRPLRKASGSLGRILTRILIFCTALEKSLTTFQLLDEHRLTSQHKLKDSPGRTGDSWRIRATGVIESELLASPPRPLRKAYGFSRENPHTYTISTNPHQEHLLSKRTSTFFRQ
ncbi:hypothetical protein DV702_09470 [Sporosarcina sp. PTS2304]|nr:hypothetical protein DV702_09470 [Sporosarcina sp. PTS2304]